MKVKITLEEFGEERLFPLEQLRKWFPSSKFDRRYPHEYLNKWLHTNEKYLQFLGVSYKWDNERKSLILTPSNRVGLAPLKNPYGGQTYGSLVVKPRLGWIKIYEILDLINWRHQPTFLEDEEPIISDGILPRWLKAIDTLESIQQALSLFMKRTEDQRITSNIPTGTINWHNYSTTKLTHGKYNEFDCLVTNYSADISIHRQFKGIIQEISNDISHPKVPVRIKYKALKLMRTIAKILEGVKLDKPDPNKLRRIYIPNFYRSLYGEAIQKCIEYLNQSKFSIIPGNFSGLPWTLEMDRLFEYWVEHWASIFAKRIGAKFYSDIKGNSKIKLYNLSNWKSLNVLRPDIIIEKNSKTLILEVKYKKHLMYFQYGKGKYSKKVLEDHRHDLHQLLSYMSSSTNNKLIGCLVYPQVGTDIPNQFATLINYTNTQINVDIILCSTSFKPKEFLMLLQNIWDEQYAYFA